MAEIQDLPQYKKAIRKAVQYCKRFESKRSAVIFCEKLLLRNSKKIGDDVKVYTVNDLRGAYHVLGIHSIAFPILVQKE